MSPAEEAGGERLSIKFAALVRRVSNSSLSLKITAKV
jgi:hypothetical protein